MVDWSAGEYERTAAELEPAARQVVASAAIAPGERVRASPAAPATPR
jgi:hypothetical protein